MIDYLSRKLDMPQRSLVLILAQLGFTLLELLIVIAIAGTLASIAIPAYSQYLDTVKKQGVTSDLRDISLRLEAYLIEFGDLPDTLAEAGIANIDPWGNPYRYIPIQDRPTSGAGKVQPRKDKFLHPINTDYDLWSMGPDGKSQLPLTAQVSRDDIIRANNGAYIGIAENY